MDDARIEHNAHEALMTEGVMVRSKHIRVDANGVGRRHVFDVVVAGDVIDGNSSINFSGNTQELDDLRSIAGLVDKITGYDNKGGFQAVHRGDSEFKIGGLLCKILVACEHSKLRVTQLNKE